MSTLWLCAALAAVSVPVAFLVDIIVPDPYMDEIFHIPQTQQYCIGNFGTWDPMITTPPGLYLVSVLYANLINFAGCCVGLQFSPDLCSPAILRSINIVFSLISVVLFWKISLHLEPDSGTKVIFFKAFALACYPLHWFFTFFFYTDVGSTAVVLAMYLASLKRSYWASAMLGFVAVLFRQTNVIWIFFVACIGVINFLMEQKNNFVASKEGFSKTLGHETHGHQPEQSSVKRVHLGGNIPEFEGVIGEILFLIQGTWRNRLELVQRFFPLLLPILAFTLFVVHNGSIVLGAKEAHKVSPHFAQVLYFGAAAMLAMLPHHLDLSTIKENFKVLARTMDGGSVNFLTAGLLGALACVHFFSLAHPYLISDNRHYTFYIWRRVINAHWSMKYLLVFIYVYAWFSILNMLGKKQRRIWIGVWVLCVVAVLVPAPLIEFRYYTIPFYFAALHMPTKKARQWVLMMVLYMAMNIVTMYIFLWRPFYKEKEEGAQRFIW